MAQHIEYLEFYMKSMNIDVPHLYDIMYSYDD